MPVFNVCCFVIRVTMGNSETRDYSSNLVTIWLLSPWLPLPRSSPMGLQNQGLYLTSPGIKTGAGQEDTKGLVCRINLSMFPTERNIKYIPHGMIGVSSDNY